VIQSRVVKQLHHQWSAQSHQSKQSPGQKELLKVLDVLYQDMKSHFVSKANHCHLEHSDYKLKTTQNQKQLDVRQMKVLSIAGGLSFPRDDEQFQQNQIII
jgi:hypothetical protein